MLATQLALRSLQLPRSSVEENQSPLWLRFVPASYLGAFEAAPCSAKTQKDLAQLAVHQVLPVDLHQLCLSWTSGTLETISTERTQDVVVHELLCPWCSSSRPRLSNLLWMGVSLSRLARSSHVGLGEVHQLYWTSMAWLPSWWVSLRPHGQQEWRLHSKTVAYQNHRWAVPPQLQDQDLFGVSQPCLDPRAWNGSIGILSLAFLPVSGSFLETAVSVWQAFETFVRQGRLRGSSMSVLGRWRSWTSFTTSFGRSPSTTRRSTRWWITRRSSTWEVCPATCRSCFWWTKLWRAQEVAGQDRGLPQSCWSSDQSQLGPLGQECWPTSVENWWGDELQVSCLWIHQAWWYELWLHSTCLYSSHVQSMASCWNGHFGMEDSWIKAEAQVPSDHGLGYEAACPLPHQDLWELQARRWNSSRHHQMFLWRMARSLPQTELGGDGQRQHLFHAWVLPVSLWAEHPTALHPWEGALGERCCWSCNPRCENNSYGNPPRRHGSRPKGDAGFDCFLSQCHGIYCWV